MNNEEVKSSNDETRAYYKGFRRGWEARDELPPKWMLANHYNAGFLKDHYWYLIVDPRFQTPMKGKWHEDTCNFTYHYAGIKLDTISIDSVLAFKELPSCEQVGRMLGLYIGKEDEKDE